MNERIDAKLALIRHLADGRWHSGEVLAKSLGISRAAVWKRLKGLESWGIRAQAVQRKGYRLPQPLEFLDKTRLHDAFSESTRNLLDTVDVFEEIDSTNSWIMAQPVKQARLCFAEFQTAGRGRRGRKWVSPFAANLYMSLAWRFESTPARLSALSLAVGIGLADCLKGSGIPDIRLKWPNDLLWRGRKLGGILIEHRGESGGPSLVVVGVGLNGRMSDEQAQDIDQAWTDLATAFDASERAMPSRNTLAAMMADALVRTLQLFASDGFNGFARRWEHYDVARNLAVSIEQDGGISKGTGRGIDADGAFLMDCNGELKRFLSGDLSLRLAP